MFHNPDLESDALVSSGNTGESDHNELVETTQEHSPFKAMNDDNELDNAVPITFKRSEYFLLISCTFGNRLFSSPAMTTNMS